MTLATRITVGFLLLVALSAAHGAYQLALFQRLHADHRALTRTGLEAARLGLEMRRRLDVLSEFSQKLVLLRDRGYAGELQLLRREMERDLERLNDLELTPAEELERSRFTGLWRDHAAAATAFEERVLAGGPNAVQGELAPGFVDLRAALGGFFDASGRAMAERVAAGEARAERARFVAWTSAGVGLATALVLSLLIARALVGPLRRLARGTRELAAGNFTYRVEEPGSAELAAVARDFNAMADRLGELDRLKEDFLSAVSHDLKAPLASIEETTRLLLDGIPGPLSDRQARLLRLNLGCCDRLSRMIGDLLDLARLDAGAIELHLEPLDLVASSREALEELGGLLAVKDLQVETSFPIHPVRADCDEALFQQALGNLISNAARFSPEGGRIGVAVREVSDPRELATVYRRVPEHVRAGQAAVEVWDSGPGVPDADKEKIFTRFYRVTGQRSGQGTGLGLAIVRRIADRCQGTVWVEDREGGGSRFVLLLESSGGLA